MAEPYKLWVCTTCRMGIDESNEHRHIGGNHRIKQIDFLPVAEAKEGTIQVPSDLAERFLTELELDADYTFGKAAREFSDLVEQAEKEARNRDTSVADTEQEDR